MLEYMLLAGLCLVLVAMGYLFYVLCRIEKALRLVKAEIDVQLVNIDRFLAEARTAEE